MSFFDRGLHYFYEISAIPRASYHEDKIADYLVSFAEAHGLSALRDSSHNVLIRKSASKKYASAPVVLLQGHTDMVCEKNADCVHDFSKEGIQILRDGDYLYADGTTLGADNGYAVAVMLAILENNGELSVMPISESQNVTRGDLNVKAPSDVVTDIIIGGCLLEDNMELLNIKWDLLKHELEKAGARGVDDVFYCYVNGSGKVIVQRKGK